MEAAAQAFSRAAPRAGRTDQRPIRLTAPTSNFSANLAKILADFTGAHPGTMFELIATCDVVDLAAGEADVAIRIAREIEDERLVRTRLTTTTASLYAAESYVERHGIPASPDKLGAYRYVMGENLPYSLVINAWLTERITPDHIVSRCSSLEAVLSEGKAGLGVGPVATSIAADHPDLVRCFPPPERTAVSSWFLISPEADCRPEVRAYARDQRTPGIRAARGLAGRVECIFRNGDDSGAAPRFFSYGNIPAGGMKSFSRPQPGRHAEQGPGPPVACPPNANAAP